MTSGDREFRVFISSTFQDLQAEREHLVKKIFPEIRALCRERGIAFTEVDLRWGLTEEHQVLGHIIRSCLDGIDRCRPYFIGITGDRYGYVPTMTEIYKDPELLEQYPWIEDGVLDESSIIEMEFRYGVSANGMVDTNTVPDGRCRFYFRELEGHEEDEEADTTNTRLTRLKKDVRRWGVPVQEFATSEQLGNLIYHDLLQILRTEFIGPEAESPLEAERQIHETFAASRRRAYIPNMEAVRRLNGFAELSDVPLVIHGPSGGGKSALLAYWAHHFRRRYPDVCVIEHYVGIGAGASDRYALMRHIMAEIRDHFGRRDELPTTLEEIERAFPNWLGFASQEQSRNPLGDTDEVTPPQSGTVVIVLDGINQLDDGAQRLAWLPAFIPQHVRLVLSVTDGEAFDQCRSRGWEVMEIQPLTPAEREAIIVRFLSEFHKALSVDRVRRITADEKCASPLFLRTMLEELRLFGEHERLEQIIDEYLSLSGIEGLFQKILERLEHDYGEEVVRDILSLIHVSRIGLSSAELAAISPHPEPDITSLLLALDFHLLRRSGLLSFFHDYLRRAVASRYVTTVELEHSLRHRLVQHFTSVPVTLRSATENCYQLFKCDEWTQLAEMLSSIEVMRSLYGGDSEYEFLGYWNSIGEREDMSSRYVAAYEAWSNAGAAKRDRLSVLLLLSRLFRSVGMWGTARDNAVASVELAVELDDPNSEIEALGLLGELQMLQGEHHEAMTSYRRQLQLATRLDDRREIAEATGNIGAIDLERGEYDAAMQHFRRMYDACQELGDRRGIARAIGQIGRIHMELRQYSDAMDCYHEQQMVSESLGDRHETGVALGQIGLLYWNQGKYDDAMNRYRRELDIAHELGDKRGITMVAGKMGLIHERRGEYEQAMGWYQQYRQLAEELGYARGIGFAHGNLASVYMHQDQFDRAMENFDRALDVHRAIDFRAGMTLWLNGKAEALLHKIMNSQQGGDHVAAMLNQARDWAKECLELSTSLGKGDTLLSARVLLARIEALSGNVEDGLQRLRLMHDAVTDPADAAMVEYELARLEHSLGNREEAHRIAESAVKRFQTLLLEIPAALYRERIEELQHF